MYRDNTVFYPQDEMTTTLLPVTLGCDYNSCIFCSMYRDCEYKEVSLSLIEMELLNAYQYTEKLFLTGADPLSIGFIKMRKILELIKHYLPYCGRVASYASVRSIARYSIDELSQLHDMGLRLLYIGFETGRDDILKLMQKGHRVKEAIEQAKKLSKAKMSFDSIIMYGIGGKGQSIDNARATAHMINQFITKRVITMNLMIFPGTELNSKVGKGEFIPSSGQERLLEIRTLIENIQPKEPLIFDTSHPTNIIKIKGSLPRDRERLLYKLKKD